YQGNKRVRYHLSQLWMMRGNVSDRGKVVKFWCGLNPNILNELYKMWLNPEVS
ncbi:hypothetical protein DFH29DRAFT_793106, partial [Suillus ampliporus]